MFSRNDYYTNILQPLQAPLLRMGLSGVPCNPQRFAFHRQATERLERMAARTLDRVGEDMLTQRRSILLIQIVELEQERKREREAGQRKFSHAKELAGLRTKLKTAEGGFNADSHPQRAALLYEWLGLPPKYKKGTKGLSTDDETINDTISQLRRGTVKCKHPDALKVCEALVAAKKWATWRRSFLNPPFKYGGEGKNPRVQTTFALHRTETGRITSGTDNSEEDKTSRKVQLQNVPKKLRDCYEADPGHVLVGADWAAIEWCIAMWFAARLNKPAGYHDQMLTAFQEKKLDPHRFLASVLHRKPEGEVTSKERKSVKQVTFGKLFLGGDVTLAQRMAVPTSFVKAASAAHLEAFKLNHYQQDALKRVAKQHYVQTPLGWRRYFWEWKPKPTEVLATEVQGTAADLMKWCMVGVFKRLPVEWECILTVHDALVLHVPASDAGGAAAFLQREMERPVPWLGGRGFRVEVKIGKSWREV